MLELLQLHLHGCKLIVIFSILLLILFQEFMVQLDEMHNEASKLAMTVSC